MASGLKYQAQSPGHGWREGLTPLKPKTLSASTPISGAPKAPIAPDAHLSKAYTDVLIRSGTTCVRGKPSSASGHAARLQVLTC